MSGRERGSILLHVMVTGAVMALIAATLLRLTMLRYQVSSRSQKMLQETNLDNSGLAALLGAWNKVNETCATSAVYTCLPAAAAPPGICGCTCTPTAAGNPPWPTVTTAPSGTPGICTLTIGAANDLP